ncbi:hypothetical protein FQN54_009644 [Arachnomyces sp. PD_36]|nr:hypothetical protein FQN54_009644 [Arachnomyces sp. PD_36]
MAPRQQKTLGRSSNSLSAPLAAFTMALLLGAYCISSIRAARRDAKHSPGMSSSHHHQQTHPSRSKPDSRTSNGMDGAESSWVVQKLEKRREEERAREEALKALRGEEGNGK